MKHDIDTIFKNADFSKGSNYKEELRHELFADDGSAKVVKFSTKKELTEDELDLISAAGLYEEQYKDKNDEDNGIK